jgi:hypothetical protein
MQDLTIAFDESASRPFSLVFSGAHDVTLVVCSVKSIGFTASRAT